MPNLDIPRIRLKNERLIGAPFEKPEEVVQWLGAVQAQDYAGAKWAVGQRVKDCVDGDVERAYASGKILRTHVMRPTWHFVTPADLRWMLELTAPRVNAAMAYYDRKLELDSTILGRSNAAFTKALEGGKQLTRKELSEVLEEAGIVARGQRLGHIVMHAELDAVICSGALRGRQHTYALLDERAAGAIRLERDEALAELARRYFTSHGPALAQDFAWWSGLTVADAKAGIEMNRPRLLSEFVSEKTYWFAPSNSTARLNNPTVHLLPNYDEYLIAYRDHSASLSASLPTGSAARYDMLARHIIVLNGLAIGGWRSAMGKGEAKIEAKLPARLSGSEEGALLATAGRYGSFLGMAVSVDGIPAS